MKVLIVFNHPAPYKVKLFNALSKHVDLDVIFERKAAKDRPNDFYNENKYNFNVKFLKRGAFGKENSNTSELKHYLKDTHKKYDLIVMNGYSTITEMRALNWLIKNNVPYVLYVNGGVIRKNFFIKRILKEKYITNATSYFSPSKESDEYLIHYGANKDSINRYTYSTFSEDEILSAPLKFAEKEKIRSKFGLPTGRLVVTAGQFIERKNNLALIRQFKDKDEKLILIGSGKEEHEYRKYIEENKLTNVFIFPFMKKHDLFEALSACDVFVTLSKEDIYGHTINEAMACGLPVVSSNNVNAAKKLIQNGLNGYIVSDDEAYNAIISCFNLLSSDCLTSAKKNTIDISAFEHVQIFKDLIK